MVGRKFWPCIITVFISQIAMSFGMIYLTSFFKAIVATVDNASDNYQAIMSFAIFDIGMFVVVYCTHKIVYSLYRPYLCKFLFDTLGEHLMYQDKKYFTRNKTGEILHATTSVCNALPDMVDFCYSAVFVIVVLVTSAVLAFKMHSHIGMIFVSWVCLWVVINAFFGIRGAGFSQEMTSKALKMFGNLSDTIDNMSQVRSVCAEKYEVGLMGRSSERVRYVTTKAEFNFLCSQVLQTSTFIMTEVWMYMRVGGMCREGILGPADLAQLITMIGMVVSTLWSSSRQIARFIQDCGVYNRSISLLGAAVIKYLSTPSVALKGEIKISDLTFSHPEVDGLFRGLNLYIREGEKVGLVGRSGSGKTTLVNLIMGHERREYAGSIFVGGVDIKSLSVVELRSCFAFVPQKVTLFQRTIRDNIAYGLNAVLNAFSDEGDGQVLDEDVVKAARCACADKFIVDFPRGYQTVLNCDGLELSGGQQQRLMLARAFLRLNYSEFANILIVDEGTSALDNETERDIKVAMARAMQGKTAIVIAHRLSTLEQMNRIIFFDRGQIVEEGTHHELLAKGGSYKSAWDAQLV